MYILGRGTVKSSLKKWLIELRDFLYQINANCYEVTPNNFEFRFLVSLMQRTLKANHTGISSLHLFTTSHQLTSGFRF